MKRYDIVTKNFEVLEENPKGIYVALKDVSYSNSSLCKDCRKNNICNPHLNYGIQAIVCSKYVERKSNG